MNDSQWRMLLAAKIDMTTTCAGFVNRMGFTAECLRMLADIANAPGTTCADLPGIAERLLKLREDVLQSVDTAKQGAIVADHDAEFIETMLTDGYL